MQTMDNFTKSMIATGVAGFTISMELLAQLQRSGQMPDQLVLDIADRALAAVEAVDSDHEHEVSRLARELLEACLKLSRTP